MAGSRLRTYENGLLMMSLMMGLAFLDFGAPTVAGVAADLWGATLAIEQPTRSLGDAI